MNSAQDPENCKFRNWIQNYVLEIDLKIYISFFSTITTSVVENIFDTFLNTGYGFWIFFQAIIFKYYSEPFLDTIQTLVMDLIPATQQILFRSFQRRRPLLLARHSIF